MQAPWFLRATAAHASATDGDDDRRCTRHRDGVRNAHRAHVHLRAHARDDGDDVHNVYDRDRGDRDHRRLLFLLFHQIHQFLPPSFHQDVSLPLLPMLRQLRSC